MENAIDMTKGTKVLVSTLLLVTLSLCIYFWFFYENFAVMNLCCLALVLSFLGMLAFVVVARMKQCPKKKFNRITAIFLVTFLISFLVYLDRFLKD